MFIPLGGFANLFKKLSFDVIEISYEPISFQYDDTTIMEHVQLYFQIIIERFRLSVSSDSKSRPRGSSRRNGVVSGKVVEIRMWS
ncbi:hypothetical protein [Azospirillum doebereinerae]